jgi:hypothetical protein
MTWWLQPQQRNQANGETTFAVFCRVEGAGSSCRGGIIYPHHQVFAVFVSKVLEVFAGVCQNQADKALSHVTFGHLDLSEAPLMALITTIACSANTTGYYSHCRPDFADHSDCQIL